MTALTSLLDSEPAVAAAGAGLLADALRAQGAEVTQADWRPPPPGTGAALVRVAADTRTGAANDLALERLVSEHRHDDECQYDAKELIRTDHGGAR